MTKAQRIYWIDDNPKRAATARDINATFINLTDENGGRELEQIVSGPQPRLVVVDHILDKTADNISHLFRRGSTIAGALKEHWPACPVVGITNAGNLAMSDARSLETYDDLFKFEEFGSNMDRIEAIADGFSKVARMRRITDRNLIKRLGAPAEDIDRLTSILPDSLKRPKSMASVPSRTYQWVEYLRVRPGFLFDRSWTATYLGLNPKGFAIVEVIFEAARYSGIFAHPSDPRWWRSGVAEILYQTCEPKPGESAWHVGPRLAGITKNLVSKCYSCGGEFPETLAYIDEVSSQTRAMHLKCTVAHPGFKRELHFEDIRMMKGA